MTRAALIAEVRRRVADNPTHPRWTDEEIAALLLQATKTPNTSDLDWRDFIVASVVVRLLAPAPRIAQEPRHA